MKHFIKVLFIVTLSTTLFAKNKTVTPAPEVTNNNTQQIINDAQPEISDESNTPPQTTDTTVDAAPILIDESTTEDNSPLEDIRDIRPAVDLPIETWQIIAILCALLALLMALIYIIKRRRGQNSGISIIPPDPYHKALQELEAALQLIQRLDQRPFATGITDSVRGYLAAVFSLPAPECTTEEVLEQLPNVTLLTEDLRQNITHLLQQCDLAKFTKLQFDQPNRLNLYNQAKNFIQSADKLIQLQNANTPEP